MNRKRTTPSHNVLPQKKRNVSIPIVLTLEQQYVQRKKKKKKKRKEQTVRCSSRVKSNSIGSNPFKFVHHLKNNNGNNKSLCLFLEKRKKITESKKN